MYAKLLKEYAKNIEFSKLKPAATEDEIQEAEKKLDIMFPKELRVFLEETNGDDYLCLPVSRIVEDNLQLRRGLDPEFFNANEYLFIAENGCGDYYGYKIEDGEIRSNSIYIWEHEEFEVRMVAVGIAELIKLYYQDQI